MEILNMKRIFMEAINSIPQLEKGGFVENSVDYSHQIDKYSIHKISIAWFVFWRRVMSSRPQTSYYNFCSEEKGETYIFIKEIVVWEVYWNTVQRNEQLFKSSIFAHRNNYIQEFK